MMKREVELIKPHSFEQEKHFYPKALNSQLHSLVNYFFDMSHERIVKRYTHLHPQLDPQFLMTILKYQSKHFFWGGSDLFYVTTDIGNRSMVVLETNSCPSGQKSMPPRSDSDEYRGYRCLIENSFLPLLNQRRLPKGDLAVIYDKNYMENSGYAATIADLTDEDVYLVPHFNREHSFVSFDNGIMYIDDPSKGKVAIRAAFRYVTQRPWNRMPIETKTLIYNSTLTCLAGGRNKLLADKAYEIYNLELMDTGLQIRTPKTIRNVDKLGIPLWVKKFGGHAVVKNPYSNAGQGVFTIVNEDELYKFMNENYPYDQFIVQHLIGHYNWSSREENGNLFHIGTIPNTKGNIYIFDLRMMVYSTEDGFYPCAIYARRALGPIRPFLENSSWDVLGTNLSIKKGENEWGSDTSRLLLMDRKDFNSLGLGTDDLIDAYIQTILSIIAIDKMAQNLMTSKGPFSLKLFKSLNNDDALIREIMI